MVLCDFCTTLHYRTNVIMYKYVWKQLWSAPNHKYLLDKPIFGGGLTWFGWSHLCWNLLSCPLSLFFNSCSFCSLCCFSSSCSRRWFSIFLWCSRSSCWCFNARSSCCCCRKTIRITSVKTQLIEVVKQINKQTISLRMRLSQDT